MFEPPHVTRFERDGAAVVTPVGEFDLSWSEQLREELATAITTMSPRAVVDLSGTTFLDSSGVGALVSAGKLARSHAGWLRLVAPRDNVRRILRITEVDTVLGLYDTIEQAIAHDEGASDRLPPSDVETTSA
jgi:anti-anti-sigma factor